MELRNYQSDLFNQVTSSDENQLIQLDTGAGKTPIIAKVAQHYDYSLIVCHRNILIKQASEKLAMCGVDHAIMASSQIKKISATNNLDKTGRNCIDHKSNVFLVSIDTFNSKLKNDDLRFDINKKWVMLLDEAHHFAENNKWEIMQNYFNCRVIGFTATPIRGDGQPMIKQFGGFFDQIVQAKGYENNATETLIAQGWLSEYDAYYCAPAVFVESENGSNKIKEEENSNIGKQEKNKLVLGKNALDVVIKKCKNKKSLVVFQRIDIAINFCNDAKKKGHRAEAIHSGLPNYEIQRILSYFEKGQIKTLVSVDMINEGFDLPAVDALLICRNIRSFGFYRQICGRVLRPQKGKRAVIYDLIGTCIPKHGLPSDAINWRKEQKFQVQKNLIICPFCDAFIKSSDARCKSCNNEIKDDHRGKYGRNISIEQYLSIMKKMHRNQVSQIQKEKLKQQQLLEQKKLHENTYIDHRATFSETIIGKRCEFFFKCLKKELRYLSCVDYNDFFIKNKDEFLKIEFYVGIFTHSFDENKHNECKQLYEIKTCSN